MAHNNRDHQSMFWETEAASVGGLFHFKAIDAMSLIGISLHSPQRTILFAN
jgi:hypothetical protein